MKIQIQNFVSAGMLFLFNALVVGALVLETHDAIVVKGKIGTNNFKN